MKALWGLATAVCGAWLLAGSPAWAAEGCAAAGKVSYLCGPSNAEDLALVPGTDWMISSGMAQGGAGHLYLIDTRKKTWKVLEPAMSGPAQAPYGDCPGPLEPGKMAPHGLALRPGAGGRHTLYAVNHGGRESVEVLQVEAKGGADPVVRWVGCVVMPEGADPNSVAPTPEGGFIVSKFDQAGDPQAFPKMVADQNTGALYEWKPGAGISMIPGTEFPGDNGVEVSADGKWLFVNIWPRSQVLRFQRGSSAPPVSVKVDFLPDNMHWAPDGKLLVAGQAAPFKSLFECKGRCPHAWSVVRLDPATMQVTPVLHEEGSEAFSDATGAIQVGNEIWVGTYRGDRLAHAPAH